MENLKEKLYSNIDKEIQWLSESKKDYKVSSQLKIDEIILTLLKAKQQMKYIGSL